MSKRKDKDKTNAPRTLSDELRRLVREQMAAGVTRYEITKGAGFTGGTFYAWLDDPTSHGSGQTLDRIAAYLGVGIRASGEKIEKKLVTETTTAQRLTSRPRKLFQKSVIPD